VQGWFEEVWVRAQPGVEYCVDVGVVLVLVLELELLGGLELVEGLIGVGEPEEIGLEDLVVEGEGAGRVVIAVCLEADAGDGLVVVVEGN
jgi:hypothetical protein